MREVARMKGGVILFRSDGAAACGSASRVVAPTLQGAAGCKVLPGARCCRVQGAAVDSSRTLLSEATIAAGVCIGITRGRQTYLLHIVAENLAAARAQFITMERDPYNHDPSRTDPRRESLATVC